MEKSVLNKILKKSEHANLVIQEGVPTLSRQLLRDFCKNNIYSESGFVDYVDMLHFVEVKKIVNENYLLNKGLILIGEEYLYKIFNQTKKVLSNL